MAYDITKKSLRGELKLRRKSLEESYCRQSSETLVSQFLRFVDLSAISCIHLYIPIKDWNEPDTTLLITALRQIRPEIRFVVPVVVPGSDSLKHAMLEDPPLLELNAWGIPEPRTHCFSDPSIVDLVLIPFLGIDPYGNRIGFGKGYYDRFLAHLSIRTRKIAYGYEAGRIAGMIPTEITDVRVDALLTESAFYQYR